MVRDLYYDLGVSRDAGPKELRNAIEWLRANRTETSMGYQRGAQAYAVLSDPELRREYDVEVARRDRGASLRLLGGAAADPPEVTVYLDAPRPSRRRLVLNEQAQAGWRGLISRRR
jgi:curved DNA-binding protein CbpA